MNIKHGISSKLIENFNVIIEKDNNFYLTEDEKSEVFVHSQNGFQSLTSSLFCKKTNQQIRTAEVFSKLLKNINSNDLDNNSQNPCVLAARKFAKNLSSKAPFIDQFNLDLLAVRLGIDVDYLKANREFAVFADRYKICNYLKVYGDLLKTEKVNGQLIIKIRYENQYIDWKEAFKLSGVNTTPLPGAQAWKYDQTGLIDKDMFDWKSLRLFRKDNPEKWNHQYGIEICTCCDSLPRTVGDHSWLRLYTPEGEIYSVGLYRPYKTEASAKYNDPLRVQQGLLMSPDVSEFWDIDIQGLFTAITKEQFESLRKHIESDKSQDNILFQLFDYNCVAWINKILKPLNMVIPAKKHIFSIFFPRGHALYKKLPVCIQKIVKAVITFFFNIAQWTLAGARKIDATLTGRKIKAEPHLRKCSDIFDSSKLYLNHPFYLGKSLMPEVSGWREKRIEKVRKQIQDYPENEVYKKKLQTLELKQGFQSLPKSFRLSSKDQKVTL
jgi:hypothetical protein